MGALPGRAPGRRRRAAAARVRVKGASEPGVLTLNHLTCTTTGASLVTSLMIFPLAPSAAAWRFIPNQH
jgi:hypothetical protein